LKNLVKIRVWQLTVPPNLTTGALLEDTAGEQPVASLLVTDEFFVLD